MFTIFQEEKFISALMGLFLVLSILARLALGLLYQRMIKETDNMASTDNKLLKQCKLKFANCFQLNNGVSNIPIFVDKFLNRLTIGHMTFDAIYHLSGQLMLLSVVCSGIGVCKSIVQGRMVGEILPFYIVSFLGLYVYFSVSTIVDIKGKRRVLKVNLVDYLENHLSSRIDVTDQDIQMLYGKDWVTKGQQPPAQEREQSVKGRDRSGQERIIPERITAASGSGRKIRSTQETGFTKEQEKELEELLLEFLTS